jgi:mRNA interferase MazF
MTEPPAFRRGDIVLVRFPLVGEPAQSKVRPAAIIQNDIGNRFGPNLIVAAISSQLPRRDYPTSFIVRANSPDAEGTGFDRDSVVHAETILTISKRDVSHRMGRFSQAAMRSIDQCLMVSLGLG